MPAWLCEHSGNDLRLPDLLQGRSYQRQSLSVGLDEYRCWLLQEEDTWDLLSKRHLPIGELLSMKVRVRDPHCCLNRLAGGLISLQPAVQSPTRQARTGRCQRVVPTLSLN